MPSYLTLIAARDHTTLTRAVIGQVREAIGGGTPIILSEGEAADIPCQSNAVALARSVLAGLAVDVVHTIARGRRRGLLVADMDSTIVTTETLDELANFAGLRERIAAITFRSMNGEIDFSDALRERVSMLRGLHVRALEDTWRRTELTAGARTLVATMRAHNATCALVSGGFTFFSERVAALCGFDHHEANVLLEADGKLTGAVAEPILDRGAKLAALHRLAAGRGLKLRATLAVGDGANDLPMLQAAGLGIAFRARPVVAAGVENRVDFADLTALLFAQGYPRARFVEG